MDRLFSSSQQMLPRRGLTLKSSSLSCVTRWTTPQPFDRYPHGPAATYPINIWRVTVIFPFGPPAYTNLHHLRRPYFTVHGSRDKWFLCAKVYRPDLVTWEVIYNVTAGVRLNEYSELLNVVV